MNLPLNLMKVHVDCVQILCGDPGGFCHATEKVLGGHHDSRALANPVGRSRGSFAKKTKAL